MSDDRLKRAVELVELARKNSEVRMGVTAVLEKTGCTSIGHLAIAEPDVFDEVHEAMVDMVAQLPVREEGLLG